MGHDIESKLKLAEDELYRQQKDSSKEKEMLLSKHSSEIQSLQKQWHENVHKETMSLRRELEDEMKRKIDNIRDEEHSRYQNSLATIKDRFNVEKESIEKEHKMQLDHNQTLWESKLKQMLEQREYEVKNSLNEKFSNERADIERRKEEQMN